jgi:hypothetical protein
VTERYVITTDQSYENPLGLKSAARECSFMASNLHPRVTEADALSGFDEPTKHYGNWGIRPEKVSLAAPWSKSSWGLFLPVVFAGNVVVATLAWFLVGLFLK